MLKFIYRLSLYASETLSNIMVVSNSVRAAIWAILIVGGYFLGVYATATLGLECPILV